MPDDTAGGQALPGVGEMSTTTVATNTANANYAMPSITVTPFDGQAPEGQVPEGQELDGEFDPQRALATIKKLRGFEKSAKELEKRLKDYETRERAAEEAKLSEQEKLTRRAQQLEADLRHTQQQHQDRELDWALERAAAKQGCADPEAARLLLRQSDLLEVDDQGRPKNVDQALKLLLKERPWLAGTPNGGPPASVGNPATRLAQPGQRTYTRADLQDHSVYLKNRDDILAAYREGRITD